MKNQRSFLGCSCSAPPPKQSGVGHPPHALPTPPPGVTKPRDSWRPWRAETHLETCTQTSQSAGLSVAQLEKGVASPSRLFDRESPKGLIWSAHSPQVTGDGSRPPP